MLTLYHYFHYSEKGHLSNSEEDSIQEDLHSMIKVEVHETDSVSPPVSRSAPPHPTTPTPPASTSSANRIPNMPPLHLVGKPNLNPEQMMLNHTSELLAKQNMFFFGDVTVAEHPDAPPVPMVIPMVYLYPLPSNNKENIKYRMFVPLGGGLGPELLAPPVGPPPALIPSDTRGGPSPTLPKLIEKARSESDLEVTRPVGSSTPLDLSKSPEANNNRGDISDPEETIVPDQRPLPPLRRGSLVKEEELRSHQREIEAHLQFLKAKQLEFLKGQQQKQAAANAALAAAQAAAVAAQQKSRCEECNINFSKHQNYVAHKKYYCSAAASTTASNSKLPIMSDNEDDKSSDDGKSQRKLSPPMTSPNLIMGLTSGLTSPKESKNGKNFENIVQPVFF